MPTCLRRVTSGIFRRAGRFSLCKCFDLPTAWLAQINSFTEAAADA